MELWRQVLSSHPCQPSTPLSPAYLQCSTICTVSLSAGLSPCERRSPRGFPHRLNSLLIGRNNCRQHGTLIVADQCLSLWEPTLPQGNRARLLGGFSCV